jgi:hypothetical protein
MKNLILNDMYEKIQKKKKIVNFKVFLDSSNKFILLELNG